MTVVFQRRTCELQSRWAEVEGRVPTARAAANGTVASRAVREFYFWVSSMFTPLSPAKRRWRWNAASGSSSY